MAVRFVIGRSGSGKTHHCFTSIVEAIKADPLGPPIYWLLPKQATFLAERSLTCLSGLPALCRAKVVSFDLLGQEVLNECGGVAMPQVTPAGRQMILGHLLRKHSDALPFFASAYRQIGLASELDSAFVEFERSGKTPAELSNLSKELEAADVPDPTLFNKLRDLGFLFERYVAFIGQDRLDPQRRLERVLEKLADCSAFKNAAVYVDEFVEFSDAERKMLVMLSRTCASVDITLLLDPADERLTDPHRIPGDLYLFHRTAETYRRLRVALDDPAAGVDVDEPILLHVPHRFRSPTTRFVEKHFDPADRRAPAFSQTPDGVRLLEAADRRTEVDAAARHVRSLLRQGLRLRDVAVLVRDIDNYHELIDASFSEHDLPFFADRRRGAAHHPLLQYTRSLMLVAMRGWPNEASIALLKSGLVGLSRDEADELENYVLLHRIRGDAWTRDEPWQFDRRLTRSREDELDPPDVNRPDVVDGLRRRLGEPMRSFITLVRTSQPVALRTIVTELFKVYERHEVRRTLAVWMDAAEEAYRLEERAEHEQVWSELMGLFDQMVDLLGDERVTPGDFLDILESGLEQFDLAITPPTVDQILVGSVERTRTPPVRAVVLLGLAEGEWPRVASEGSILSDDQRRVLSDRGVLVEADSRRKLLDETLLGYVGMTAASEHICLSRPLADDAGRPLEPSVFYARIRRLFPSAGVLRSERPGPTSIESIGTARQLVSTLMKWARLHRGEDPGPAPDAADGPCRWMYDRLARRAPQDDAIGRARASWSALAYSNDAALSPEIAARLFRSPLDASVSRVEAFATCPHKHFLQYGLKLREREEQDVTALDLGNVYHEVLEKIVRRLIRAKQDWASLPPDETDALIRTYAKEVGESLRGEILLSSSRNEYLLARIEHTLKQVVAAQAEISRRGRVRPGAGEYGFGVDGSALPPYELTTPSGKRVVLHGKIDRIDLLERQAAVAVVDYKLTQSRLELDRVYHGISLQLLTYLLVLKAQGDKLTGKTVTPVAAFYVRLLRSLDKVAHPSDAKNPDDPSFHLANKPRGLFDSRYLDQFDSSLDRGTSEVVQVTIKADGTLGSRGRSDAAEPHEFAAMLELVRARLGELADGIMGGAISAAPYLIKDLSPCPRCPYAAVCRFDRITNRYHVLQPMSREAALDKAVETHGKGAHDEA